MLGFCVWFYVFFKCIYTYLLIPSLAFSRDHANNRIPRSSSIDSMVEAVWNASPRSSLTVPNAVTPSQPHIVYTTGPDVCSCDIGVNPTTVTLTTSFNQHQQQRSNQHCLQINYDTSVSRRESVLSPTNSRRSKMHQATACK